jgi:uncharacterized transporter YbjL
VGLQFFRALKKDAMPQLVITVVLAICLLAAYGAAKLLGYEPAMAAGMLAGAFLPNRRSLNRCDAINRRHTGRGQNESDQ